MQCMCQAIWNGPWSIQCYQWLDLFSLNLCINLWKLIFFPWYLLSSCLDLPNDCPTYFNENPDFGLGLELIFSYLNLSDTTLPIKPQESTCFFLECMTEPPLIPLADLGSQSRPSLQDLDFLFLPGPSSWVVKTWQVLQHLRIQVPRILLQTEWAILIILSSDRLPRGFCICGKKTSPSSQS